MIMKPLHNKILVRPFIEEKTKSGLFLPSSEQKQAKGKVIEIGTKVKNCKVGDTVLFYKDSGVNYPIENVEHLFLEMGKEGIKGEVIAVIPHS